MLGQTGLNTQDNQCQKVVLETLETPLKCSLFEPNRFFSKSFTVLKYAKCSMYNDCHSENSSFASSLGIPGLSSGDSRSSTSFLTG